MSTQTKSGGGGRTKSTNKPNAHSVDSTKKVSDHNKTEKEKPQAKPTAEQIRIAQITDIKSNVEDPKIREKIDQLMETTQRSEEDVCYALYECDNDVEKAVIYLLETLEVGAFATTSKKKKNRSATTTNDGNSAGGTNGDGWDELNNNTSASLNSNNTNSNNNNNISDNRDRSRGRGGMRGGGGRGRPRDNDGRMGIPDRSGMDKGPEAWRGGRGGAGRGTGRGGGYGSGSRGGRGGRMGPRGPNYRDNHRNNYRSNQDDQGPESTIVSWDSSQINTDIITKNEDTWGDWDNEEYTGSLSDTKVFTPSTANQGSVSNPSDLSAPPGLDQQILSSPSQNDVQQYSTTVVSSTATSASVNNNVQYPELHSASTAAQHLRQALELPQLSQTTSLSAEQSQYFNTLSSQNSNVNSYQSSSVQYQYGDHQVSAQQAPVRRQARARVPPPSKIPSSAVEMPGDLNSMGFLDVQFGGLEFGTEESSIDNVADKFNAASIDNVTGTHNVVQQANDVSDYQSKLTSAGVSKSSQSSSMAASLPPSLMQQTADSMTTQADSGLSYGSRGSNNAASMGSSAGSNMDPLVKSDPYNQSSNQTSATSYQNLSYSTSNKNSGYQNSSGGYNSNNYNTSQQVSSTNNYPSSNTYNSYNQSSYQPSQTQSNQQQNPASQNSQQSLGNASSVVNNSVSGSSNPNIPAGGNSTGNSNYLSNQYSVSQTSGYPSQQSYQTNQSVYGSGLNNTGYSGSTGNSAVQYSNFNSKLKDTPASTTFDNSSSNSVSSGVTSSSVSNNSITTSSISSPSTLGGLTNTKATTISSMTGMKTGSSVSSGAGGNNSSGGTSATNNNVVQNIPVVSQFIQTTSVPYYQQQFVQYEDIQLVPQRMTHMPGYYEMSNVNYPTPTSLAAGVRSDGTTGNMATVAYSAMTDGRFTRTDNNSSPVSNVPSTISQQTGSGGPMLNIPPYTTVPYYFGANMMAGGFQQATYPQLYPQQMATANPTSGGQYPKPSFYNSGSTGYESLGQTPQDYNKTAYPSAGGVSQQAKGQSVSNQSGGNSDIASSMYSKSHVALNKVNSYDKQSFHSGTPPPFNLAAGSQTAGSQATQAAYGQHLFIPAAITAHHIHQPMHQIDGSGRLPNSSRRDTNNSGQRQQITSSKAQSKTGYSQSYWATQN